jgi:hypothetical protein
MLIAMSGLFFVLLGPNYAIKRDLRENTGFKFIIGRVGPLFWLLDPLLCIGGIMSNVIAWSSNTIGHLENDLSSFQHVLSNPACSGKLCIALVATAMTAFDAYAFVLYQQSSPKLKNNELFTKLLSDSRFFDIQKYLNDQVFYKQIRCGVAHQVYPKAAGLFAIDNNVVLYQDNGELRVNAFALYKDVIRGIKSIHDHFNQASDLEMQRYENNYLGRVQNDQVQGAASSFASLPSLP